MNIFKTNWYNDQYTVKIKKKTKNIKFTCLFSSKFPIEDSTYACSKPIVYSAYLK